MLEMLLEEEITKADFHCFCGKVIFKCCVVFITSELYLFVSFQLNLAKKIADAGYYLSIPAAVESHDSFQKIVKTLPLNRLLTETGE